MKLSTHLQTVVGDITMEQCDVIVNAANRSLLGGGGVDGAIHRAGGPVILQACRKIRQEMYPDGLPVGKAVATTAGDMPASYVIHTVGPIYGQCGSNCARLLGACYRNALRLAVELGGGCIAFPAISTGVYGYPKAEAAKVAYAAITAFLKTHTIEVRLLFYSAANEALFLRAIVEE